MAVAKKDDKKKKSLDWIDKDEETKQKQIAQNKKNADKLNGKVPPEDDEQEDTSSKKPADDEEEEDDKKKKKNDKKKPPFSK